MNVDVKRYKDFYVFLRHRQWGDGKVLISSHTSHAVVLLLTEGYSQWYTLAPRYVDHLRTIEGGTDMSIKSWIKHNNILFEDETNIDITLSIREEIVRDATFLARAKGEKGLSIRPFDTNYSSDSYMPIQQDDRTTVLQTTRIMIMTWLQDIVESADACHQVCELRENEAEDYEEALQKVLDWTSDTTNFKSLFPFASDKDVQTLRRRTRRLLINLVKESQQLPPSLFIKETVDNYGKDPIAGGGFADIFKGLCGGKAVAMKRVRFFLTQTREVVKHRRMFAQEVLVWRQLKHDSILPLRGIWSQSPESVPYMILPWMNNGNAMNYTQDVSVASQTVDRLLREIAEGLIYLHAEDIIHGDLCGRNILIDESCHAKLCDFGLASLFTAPNSQLYSATSRMTQGSLPWMAPELLNSGPTLGADSSEPTYRSDVYAFGVVGWELYSGQTPFAGLRDFEIHSGVSSGRKLDNPGAGAYGRTMSRGLWALLLLCMRHTASDRPNAVTILESLQLL
ncbi:hypothetical protein JAAARDRAFT_62452 [Jaapia argillacea MUCL 33604]|uniref:Protein kinase domain-containing protein n=1 Tax=Jaapia argillacea MUCL 33604 TaxID=933084 RepID=A0A067PCL5_9AGAM|nr:hypothetical protein JAAARDRAFT_62452 [Jaapia argillacea MUCL 33604]